jgi:hypothetical protein
MIRMVMYSLVSFIVVGYAGAFPDGNHDLLGLAGAWVMFVCVAMAMQGIGILISVMTGVIGIEIVDQDEYCDEDSEE